MLPRKKYAAFPRKRTTLNRKKRDALLKKIAWICVLLAVVVVSYLLRETPDIQPQTTSSTTTPVSVQEATEGHELFHIKTLGVGFQYPKYQAPLRAVKGTSEALFAAKSRDYFIEFYESAGFVLYPWSPEGLSVFCTYDGALRSFTSSKSNACSFRSRQTTTQPFYYASFTRDNTYKHIAVLPVDFRRYFMVITADYQKDCGQNQTVCEARSAQKLDMLLTFASHIVEKNHNLFTP